MATNISYEFIQFVRVLLQDQDRTEFTDERIKELISVAGRLVIQEVPGLSYNYTISILQRSIDPDPFTVSDEQFVNLVAMKAGCIYDQGAMRKASLNAGVKITQEKTIIDTAGRMDAFKTIISLGYCASYEKLKSDIQNQQTSELLISITTPIKTIDSFPTYGGDNYPQGNRYCR